MNLERRARCSPALRTGVRTADGSCQDRRVLFQLGSRPQGAKDSRRGAAGEGAPEPCSSVLPEAAGGKIRESGLEARPPRSNAPAPMSGAGTAAEWSSRPRQRTPERAGQLECVLNPWVPGPSSETHLWLPRATFSHVESERGSPRPR